MIEITTAIVAIVVFALSVWLNIFLIRKLLFFSENIDVLAEAATDFEQHLERVNAMETYYGDETLAELLEHSSSLAADLQDFKDTYGELRSNDKERTEKAQA